MAAYSNKSYYYNLERCARLGIDIHPPPEDFGPSGSGTVDTDSDDDGEEEGGDSPSRLEFVLCAWGRQRRRGRFVRRRQQTWLHDSLPLRGAPLLLVNPFLYTYLLSKPCLISLG